jgi:23S rRNA (cytosine1962-C5)-methyltransferase
VAIHGCLIQPIAKGGADAGETVRVESEAGQFLGWAAFSPTSKIRARIWSFKESERIDAGFFERQVATAVAMRSRLQVPSNGVRLIHGEADGIPGLIVDSYDGTLVAQFLSAGTERFKADIVKALVLHTGATRVFERSDSGVRVSEGLESKTGWLFRASGANDSTAMVIQEHHWSLELDILEGHKTGFYLDQRDSRLKFAEYAQRLGLQQVLNCYGYTGGFSVAALSGMRSAWLCWAVTPLVTTVDSSAPAIAKAQANVQRNGFDGRHVAFLDADVNATLRSMHKEGRRFDGIVLDPPKFAPSAAHAERAARAYKDINRWAFKLLSPGGVLFTYSCSGGISPELFHKIVASAGTDAQVDAYILDRVHAAPDHPMTVCFPEGEYLKGLVLMKK